MLPIYDVRRLPEEGETIDEPLENEWLSTALNDGEPDPDLHLTAQEPGHAQLRLHRVNPDSPGDPIVRIKGEIDAKLSQPCVRCLSVVAINVASQVDATLFPLSFSTDAEPVKGRSRVELKKVELDEGTYEGHTIDLNAIAREAILLEIAMNPVCADEAACAERTEHLLAAATDGGVSKPIDPRWASLAALKDKLSS